jgi:O-acetylhomoserine/O-acetylserine sulfhydrylase-like pyridoxal-dependent enzyme
MQDEPKPERSELDELELARQLSPLRKTTRASSIEGLAREQLAHFSVDPDGPIGRELVEIADHVYRANAGVHRLWGDVLGALAGLDRSDRIAAFNAKRFLCFQLAKLLDTLQNPLRRNYQSLVEQRPGGSVKGPYPLFDNVTAIFSASPVITRTATYLYACAEWVDDAFQGKELLLEIYSRLMNPTSVALANHMVDLEAGPLAPEYFAWNFNSGMAAIDAVLSHLIGHQDVVLSSRNVYGGSHQLLVDWYGKKSNLDVAVEWFDGCESGDFARGLERTRAAHAERLAAGKRIYVYLESPCNPHGYVLDVPAICRIAHAAGIEVICDSTVGTPMLHPVLQREDPLERPDFVVHSYTKDLIGSGTATAGVAIARNERMFLPKGESVSAPGPDGRPCLHRWDETLFWNVYFVKGAFLDSDKAFEVINGMRTLELRMLRKCINTIVLARALAAHPDLNVHCSAVPGDPNWELREKLLFLGLPAPLFTIDFEGDGATPLVERGRFKRFFDCLEPAFGLQVSLGQMNTLVLCPAITSHSELSTEALRAAGISPTTIRIAVGDEDPRSLIAHLVQAAELAIDPARPGFSAGFPRPDAVDALYREIYLDVHRRFVESRPPMRDLLL